MRRVLWTAVALAAGVCLGCGDGGKPAGGGPADPGPMTAVEDPAGGFRLAVPQDWERMVFPPRSQENRRFAGAWGPQGVTLPQEGLLVQIMAPGCVAADFGARVSGELMATTREAKGYSVLSSGPALVGARPAFRLDAKFGSELGDLVEAAAYVETSPGAGVYVASRGPVGTEALVKARLDKALAGFESIPRVVKAGAASKRAWGISFGLPPGFEEFMGSQIPPAVAGYWVGASANNADKQAAMEAVTLILLPDVSGAAEMIRNSMAASTRGRKEGARKKFRTRSGQEIEAAAYGPEKPDQPRYETAVGGFRTKDGYAALAVNAAIAPEGRALAILETIISTLVVEDTPTPKVEGRAFGEGHFRWGAVPMGWDVQVTDDSLGALLNETMTDVPPGAPDTRARMGANTSFGEDRFGDDTPASLALWYYRRVDRKKVSPLPPESFTLADGRDAARMVVVVPGRTEVIAFARCGPAAMAEVHVSAISEDSPLAVRVATELVATARLLPLQDQPAPEGALVAAAREQLPGILKRGRGERAAEAVYLNRVPAGEGKPPEAVSAVRMTAASDGTWTDFLRSPDLDPKRKVEQKVLIETVQTGRPGLVTETVEMLGPLDGKERTSARYETTFEVDGSFLTIRRTPEGGEGRTDRIPVSDVLLPPDLTISDGALVGLAGSPEGRYAFQVINERLLAPRWREYIVRGEEEVETAQGKLKARLIEMSGRGKAWVAGGRVVRIEGSQTTRVLCDEAAAEKFLKK